MSHSYLNHSYPSHVRIVDVSPRDGLQNESTTVPTEVKQALINDLIAAGVKKLEATSFVSPKWVPQMGDNSALLDALAPTRQTDICYSVLVPNMRGFENASFIVLMKSLFLVQPVRPLVKKISIVVLMRVSNVLRQWLRQQKDKASRYVALSLVRLVVPMKRD